MRRQEIKIFIQPPPPQEAKPFIFPQKGKTCRILFTFAQLTGKFYLLWMMAIVARIAAVSYLDTIPFLYGITHEGNFRADLLLSPSPAACLSDFSEHKADIALLPVVAVPSLADARLVTDYCLGAAGAAPKHVWTGTDPGETVRRTFLDTGAFSAAQLAAWQEYTRRPFAFAVWMAHKEIDPDWITGLQYALTFGLEHTYEAICEAGFAEQSADAYGALTHNIDAVFDNQKRTALQKYWDSGLKITPRANPG